MARLLATGFDGVLHFAALSLVGQSVEHPGRYYQTNVVGTLNLLEGMRIAGVPRLVFSSTATVYGEPEEVSITEVTPTRLTNPYGGSKLAVDGMIGFHVAAHGLQATSLRYFNGAGFSVREVVRTAREVTGREIKAVEAPRRAGDPAVLVTSSQKIRDELGSTPKKPELDAIVSDAWDWMKAYPRGYGDVTNSRYTLRDPNGFASSMHIPRSDAMPPDFTLSDLAILRAVRKK